MALGNSGAQRTDLGADGGAAAGERQSVEASGPLLRQRASGRRRLYSYAVVIALIFITLVFSFLLPTTFPTVGNLRTIINSQAELLIVTLGLTVPLIAGDFDLSIGATLGFAGVLIAVLYGTEHISTGLSIVVVLVVCVTIGLANAFATVVLGINAFIATLATSTLLAGLTLYSSNGTIVTSVPPSISKFAQGEVPTLGISSAAVIGFVLTGVLWYVYQHTPLGRRLFFVGEGRDAARLTGLPVNALRAMAFVCSAVFAGLAGVLLSGELGGMSASIGPTYLLPAYAAAYLGATTIKPGRFNAVGTLVGLYLLVVGVTGLEQLGLASWVQQAFNGGVLLVAVAFARFMSRERRGSL